MCIAFPDFSKVPVTGKHIRDVAWRYPDHFSRIRMGRKYYVNLLYTFYAW